MERRRLLAMVEDHHVLAALAQAVPEGIMSEAQVAFSREVLEPSPEAAHDFFWMAISGRPGIEWSWALTLREVLKAIISEPEPKLSGVT